MQKPREELTKTDAITYAYRSHTIRKDCVGGWRVYSPTGERTKVRKPGPWEAAIEIDLDLECQERAAERRERALFSYRLTAEERKTVEMLSGRYQWADWCLEHGAAHGEIVVSEEISIHELSEAIDDEGIPCLAECALHSFLLRVWEARI